MEIEVAEGLKPSVEIFLAGEVVTMAGVRGQALVVSQGKVAFVGSLDDARARYPHASTSDFGDDACIVPGFHDAHSHPEIVAENALTVDVSPRAAPDQATLRELLAQQATAVGAGNWVLATGYRPDRGRFEPSVDVAFLDAACPNNPVYITHVSSHWGVANSQALLKLGIDPHGRFPSSLIGSDSTGKPNGFIFEERHFEIAFPALSRKGGLLPRADLDTYLASLRTTLSRYAACGITATVDALSWPGGIENYQRLLDQASLPVRIATLLSFTHLNSWIDGRVGNGEGRIRIIGAKLFADGALSGGTCLLKEPYAESEGYFGDEVLTSSELAEAMEECVRRGLPPAVHANGDRAVSRVLSVAESLAGSSGCVSFPLRIEHCSIVSPTDIQRLRHLGAFPIMLATFVGYHGDTLLDLYEPKRIESLIPCRALLDAGVTLAASSDSPAAPLSPLQGIQDLVTRRAPSGRTVADEQSIGVLEALHMYTVGGAMAAGVDDQSGRLASGFDADFTVLGNSPMAVHSSEISTIPVLSTWVGGKNVFSAG